MDQSSLAKESRDFRFNKAPASNKYLQLKDDRERLRNDYILKGILDDPNAKKVLSAAKPTVGTCTLMCPDFEAEEREYQKGLDKLEMIPGTDKVDKSKAVKTFHRSAAGNDQPLPEDIRTPQTLERTMDYLINIILPSDPTLCDVHQFIRDRTRTLQTLIEIYDEHRIQSNNNDLVSPNECEIRSYHLLTHMRDMDGRRLAERLPDSLFWSPILQQALKLARLAQCCNSLIGRNEPPNLDLSQNNFSSFFKEIKSDRTPYLLACIAEFYFVDIRRAACKTLNNSIIYQLNKEYSTERLTNLLGFDDVKDCISFCNDFGLNADMHGVSFGQKINRVFVMTEPEIKPKRKKSLLLVEIKRSGLKNHEFVNGSGLGVTLPKATFDSITNFSFRFYENTTIG
ncbi:hypothetical protein BB561_005807 [Smittium simulii]|uniref:SAC3/GANP/THP3 conserved domain-containing protein n=1 Tax=Smittium simulii TaxID=133385 RepID=A0A2T9Y854_9FUNG|nr:hypothetical protein BB561_005807 [Smittium simulii]